MDDVKHEAAVIVAEEVMKIAVECSEWVGKDFVPTRGDYEAALTRGYVLMCDAYKAGKGVSPTNIITFGCIFDAVYTLLDKIYGKEDIPAC
jgi:hypothetical protein